MKIDVQRACDAPGLPGDADFERWAGTAADGVPEAATLTIRIVDRAESRSLNARYRKRDRATNVLSFGAAPPDPMPPDLAFEHLGDLVLCAPVIADEASEQGKPLTDHWAHLVVHGMLHLRGYDHELADDAGRMEGEERRLLATLGIPDPY